jgi:Leucine-rich repeat (LRR) protein
LQQLQWLSLEYNGIVSLSELPLDHLHKLHYLSLEGNRIAAVNRNSFGGKLRSLRDVRLSHNLIESLPQHTFHNLGIVQYLNERANVARTFYVN